MNHRTAPLILLLIFFAGLLFTKVRATSYFSQALAAAQTFEVVRFDGHVCEVSAGEVTCDGAVPNAANTYRARALAYKKVLVERSPLLALAGVDTQKFGPILEQLAALQRTLASAQSNAADSGLIDHLYPLEFLQSAKDLEIARQKFIASGSEDDAHAYESLQSRTLAAYRHDLDAFANAFNTAAPTSTHAYGTATMIVDRPSMQKDFDRLTVAAKTMRREILLRGACTQGLTLACDPAELEEPSPISSDNPAGNGKIAAEVRRLYAQAGISFHPSRNYVLSQSVCIPPGKDTHFSIVPYDPGTHVWFENPFYTGDIILVPSRVNGSTSFYKYFADRSVTYVVTEPLTYYECPLALHDYSAVLSMNDILDIADHYTDAPRFFSGEQREKYNRLAEPFSKETISENDALAYLAFSLEALPARSDTIALRHSLEDAALGYSNRTRALPEFIASIIVFENGNRTIARTGTRFDVSPRNLFYIRSGFGSLFLPDLFLANGTDLFGKNTLPSSEVPYVYYSDLRSTPGFNKEIARDIQFYWRAHITPL